MSEYTGGWYVTTPGVDGETIVHGGPYKQQKDAFAAIYAGLKIVTVNGGMIASLDVEIVKWSAAEMKRYEKMLRFVNPPTVTDEVSE